MLEIITGLNNPSGVPIEVLDENNKMFELHLHTFCQKYHDRKF